MRPCTSVAKHNQMPINHLTYKINAAIFEVNRVLGPGFLEKVYQNAPLVELKDRNLKAESQVPIKVSYKGSQVGDYYADIVVENSVLIELKAVETIKKIHEAQIFELCESHGF